MVTPWLDGPGIGLPPGLARERWAERLLVDPRVSAWIAVAAPAVAPGPAEDLAAGQPRSDSLPEAGQAAPYPVGFARLDTGPDRVAELTLAVAPRFRRCGMGTRILDLVAMQCMAMRVRRLYAVVDPKNAAALHFFGEAGFEDEGVCAGAVRFVRWIHEADPQALEIEG